jgi:endoglucanase
MIAKQYTTVLVAALLAAACSSSTDDSSSASEAPVQDQVPTLPTMGATVTARHISHWQKAHGGGLVTPTTTAPAPTTTAPAPTATTPTPAPTTTTPAPTATTPPAPPPSATATNPPAPTPPPASPKILFKGVNLPGVGFNDQVPGVSGTDYLFPAPSDATYFLSKGMNTFRVAFKWERAQQQANGALDSYYVGLIDAVVADATAKGAHVVLNQFNFARYYGNVVGSSAVPNAVFADFWGKFAARYKSNANVMFNLTNEPNSMSTEQWVGAANAAIAAIRNAGAHNTIIVPGNNWTGAESWSQSYYGTSNAVAMLNIVDADDNVLFEAHNYMDSDASGGASTCTSTTIGSERMKPFVAWLRANKKKGFLGEFAGGDNATCKAAVQDLLNYVNANADVIQGWLWWAGGPYMSPDYQFTLQPKAGVPDRTLMTNLAPWLSGS